MSIHIHFRPVPHKEAMELIRNKPPVTREIFKKLLPELRARTFLISGIEDMNVLQQIRDVVAELPAGEGWDATKNKIVDALGPWMDEKAAKSRATLLLRHHGFQAYSAADYRSAVESKGSFPYWKYSTMGDERVRDSHAALNGLVLPADDPFWESHYPPWDWNCRCMVIPITQDRYDEMLTDGRMAGGSRDLTPGVKARGWTIPESERKMLRMTGRLDDGSGIAQDVRAPVQRAKTTQERDRAYRWNPRTLGMDVSSLKSHYDPNTWAMFEKQAKTVKLDDGRTIMDWLNGKAAPPATAAIIAPVLASATQIMREKIRTAKYKTKQNLGGGVNGSYVLRNGEKVVFKPQDEECTGLRNGIPDSQGKREIAASIIDEALGFDLVPPTTELEYGGQIGSAQLFAKTAKDAAYYHDSGELESILKSIPAVELEKFVLLDQVLYNTDRHLWNFMLQSHKKQWRIVAIDNGLTLPIKESDALRMPRIGPLTQFRGKTISDQGKAALQGLLDQKDEVTKKLRPLIGERATSGMFQRVERMLKAERHQI